MIGDSEIRKMDKYKLGFSNEASCGIATHLHSPTSVTMPHDAFQRTTLPGFFIKFAF